MRLTTKQRAWVEEYVEKYNETRHARTKWVMIRPTCAVSQLGKLDLHLGVPSPITDMEKALDQYCTQILQGEIFGHADEIEYNLERHYKKYNLDINIQKDFNTFLDGMWERDYYFSPTGYGKEPNRVNSYQIKTDFGEYKIWAYEVTTPSEESLAAFMEESHTFVAHKNDKASESMTAILKDTELKFIYESALLDGANKVQALATAYGQDISMVPHLNGYFECAPEYREFFVR